MKDTNIIGQKKQRGVAPTSNFVLYLVLLAGALIFTQALRARASNILFTFLLFLPLGSLLYALTGRAALRVQLLTGSAEVAKRQPYEYKMQLINESVIPYPFVDAALYLPERESVRCSLRTVKLVMSPKANYTVSNVVSFPFRGQYEIGVDCLYVYDFLRLFRVRVDISQLETVSVLPRRLDLELSRSGAVSDSARKTRRDPNSYEKIEISDIREYRLGDPLKSIHWKLSSKAEDFIVKNYDTGTSRETFVFCDLSAHFPTEPPAVTASVPQEGEEPEAADGARASEKSEKTQKIEKAGKTQKSKKASKRKKAVKAEQAEQGDEPSAADAAPDTDAVETATAAVDIERLAEDRYYNDMNEFCADGVVELAVAAAQNELRDGCVCTLAWFDARSEDGVYCFELHDMFDLDTIFRLIATAPLTSQENDVTRLSGLMKDAQDIKQMYVTAALDPESVRRLCALPCVANGASGAAEVVFYDPEERYAERSQRKLYIEGCREQLFSSGLRLIEGRIDVGGAAK